VDVHETFAGKQAHETGPVDHALDAVSKPQATAKAIEGLGVDGSRKRL
jgi:hypothetical protein